ncbi:MAG: uncharacterized protein KVP18_004353 [Porospora cf. gigantea A]|uniref:uncharacterized protein n=1 Tax=Porospora cf. gigantea A TaxID=2853593 RepID=UPI00355A9EED|nr:MAG: hypothetical protein KVP18_004353 [Porospora cf. gigantea A]
MEVLRKAGLDDAEVLAGFYRQLALESEGRRADLDLLRKSVQHSLTSQSTHILLIQVGPHPVASLRFRDHWNVMKAAYVYDIDGVYVTPEHRRQGLYRKLFKAVRDLAGLNPVLRVEVEEGNTGAQEALKHMGLTRSSALIFSTDAPAGT